MPTLPLPFVFFFSCLYISPSSFLLLLWLSFSLPSLSSSPPHTSPLFLHFSLTVYFSSLELSFSLKSLNFFFFSLSLSMEHESPTFLLLFSAYHADNNFWHFNFFFFFFFSFFFFFFFFCGLISATLISSKSAQYSQKNKSHLPNALIRPLL
jgi:hypothetical protein